ncbi:unnamed protein product [Schistocephalus solidus]|uniref:ERAP1_C domain-containing protein n=1 Tax=Schistocephalus solidus TaxID=70667 RepID=A0A183TNW1_SCHSO|nr:unnamed protein product [Schistocephalus solidus]
MDQLSLVAEHCAVSGRTFTFKFAEILGQDIDLTARETLETWHTVPTSIKRYSGSEWYVPVTICDVADSNKVLVRTVIPPRSVSKDLPTMVAIPCSGGTPPKVRLNPNAVGFYRVNYSDELLPSILDALGQHKLSALDRLSILSDQFALARAGHCSLTSALTLASSFTGETDYAIWCELRSQLNYIRGLLQEASYTSCDKLCFPPPTPAEEGLSDLVLHLAAPTFNKLGSEKVVQEAFAMFARHYKAVAEDATGDAHKPEDIIPADLRVAIYSTVLRHGGEEEFNRLLCVSTSCHFVWSPVSANFARNPLPPGPCVCIG